MQGKGLKFSYDQYLKLWKTYNYEFLVLVPQEKQKLAEEILGELIDEKLAWNLAADKAQIQLSKDPSDTISRFNLSVAYYHTGQFEKSIKEYELVQNALPMRTLWYQTEPIYAYFEVGDHAKVFEITTQVLQNHNRAFSELYALRGEIYISRGDLPSAISEYQNAVLYKNTSLEYKEKLNELQHSQPLSQN